MPDPDRDRRAEGAPADVSRAVARDLLDIGAVLLRPGDPFTWSSGLVAPIYCDARRTLGHPAVRRRLRDGFVERMREHGWDDAAIAGTATAGIPHAAWLAEATNRPMVYVRSAAKDHGTGRRIEGDARDTTRAVLVEDLVSTGGSALSAVEALRDTGRTVPAVLAIFTYRLDAAADAFARADVPLHPLCDFPTLVAVARDNNRLPADALASLRAWRDDPSAWSERHGGAPMNP